MEGFLFLRKRMICYANLRCRGRTNSNAVDAQREQIAYLSVAGCAPQTPPKGVLCPKVAHGREIPRHPNSLAEPWMQFCGWRAFAANDPLTRLRRELSHGESLIESPPCGGGVTACCDGEGVATARQCSYQSSRKSRYPKITHIPSSMNGEKS